MPGHTAVDFGAGTGEYIFGLAEKVLSTGLVYAIDIQKQLLNKISREALEKGYKNVNTVWADLEEEKSTGLSNETVDIVIVSNILFQIEDKKTLIEEAWRILKFGGLMLIVEWSDSSAIGPTRESVITESEIQKICETDSRFSFKQSVPAGDHHFAVIYSKT